VSNVSTNVCAKFRCAPLRIKKALGIFRELITTRTTTRVAFWDPPSGSKKVHCNFFAQNLIADQVTHGDGIWALLLSQNTKQLLLLLRLISHVILHWLVCVVCCSDQHVVVVVAVCCVVVVSVCDML